MCIKKLIKPFNKQFPRFFDRLAQSKVNLNKPFDCLTQSEKERVDIMEIKNLTNAIRAYEKLSSSVPAKKDREKAPVKANTDKVDFDFSGALAAAKANVASAANGEASADRVRELQAQYEGENCPVSSDCIANAILGL